MKQLLLFNLFLFLGATLFAQDKMLVHRPDGTATFQISESDSVYFSADHSIIYFKIAGNLTDYYVSEIDSITFDVSLDSTVYVTYDGSTVSVINPLSDAGVAVETDGADVVIHSTSAIKNINYVLSGTTGDGMFKIYSDERYNLLLNGVQITNNDGPAINIQSGKHARINLVAGTASTLADGPDYAAPAVDENGEEEGQSATFFSEGELIFTGSGSLTINSFGSDQHGLRSDDYIQVDEGSITITSAEKDGMHGKEGVYINGGTVLITSSGDGIDGDEGVADITGGSVTVHSVEDDVKAVKSDGPITISGGTVQITVAGKQSKGIDSDVEINLSGGDVNISTTGGVVLEASGQGYDPSYCSAINCNGDVNINAGYLNIMSTGTAGRGISCDGNLYVDGGEITITASGNGAKYTNENGVDDAYHGSCINVDGDFVFNSGAITASNSGSGGKGISTDGGFVIGDGSSTPVLGLTTTGARITITSGGPGPGSQGDYDESKTIKSDGPVTINSGLVTISSADDGIKSDEAITMNGGSVSINQSVEGVEAPNITMNGGEISIYASDDGFNATYGNGGEQNDGSLLAINGGYVHISASGGDAMDSNGNISISGGTIVVHGPQSSPEVGMDVNGSCLISGGFLVISGTNSNMTEGASNSSTQYSLLLRTNSAIPANTLFHLEDSNGNELVTFAPRRNYYSIIFSSSQLANGATYKLYTGGTHSGQQLNGLYTGGSYSGGTLKKTFTISNIVTNVSF
ncbi:MAG: carbohydrate-binding domain-containing protein [Lewinellaceae bacterium]|nr:carbohydrate-binding domain-containing protein [Lewinellaceae bacterium]